MLFAGENSSGQDKNADTKYIIERQNGSVYAL